MQRDTLKNIVEKSRCHSKKCSSNPQKSGKIKKKNGTTKSKMADFRPTVSKLH